MWWLDFRIADVGGGVQAAPILYEDDRRVGAGLTLLPPSPDGVAFVAHGYNNDRAEGVRQIKGFVDAVPTDVRTRFVGVLWPGDALVGFLSYPVEEADADETALAFARSLYAARLPGPVHLVAHSLGSRVVLQTATHLAHWAPARRWIDQVVLLAAAVDHDCLARRDRYVAGVRVTERLVNVASTEDNVLRWVFPVGDFLGGLFGGYTTRALGLRGPAGDPAPPPGVRPVQIPEEADVGHFDYLGGDTYKRRRASVLTGRALTGQGPLVY